jgi:mannose-6-phosphate isomerase-like protein (cupin superfamily)
MKIRISEHAKFQTDRMARIALARTGRAQLDLYCLEPGQEQKAHVHPDMDKFYVVLDGRGRFVLDGVETTAEPGEAVVAAAGASHGVRNDGPGRLTVLVVVSPPPPHA